MKVPKHPDRAVIIASIDDAEHFSKEQKDQIIASYPKFEREARVRGIPVLGSGRVFPVAEEKIAIPQRTFPAHFARLGGIDFGCTPRRPSKSSTTGMRTLSMSLSAIA